MDFFDCDYIYLGYLFIVSFIYLYIAYVDYKTHYISDLPILISAVCNVFYAICNQQLLESLFGGIVAGCIHGIIYYLVKHIYNEEKYGMGDVLLMVSIGLMLGMKDFLQYQCMEMTLSGILAVFVFGIKRTDIVVPMAPVYVFWLIVFLGLRRPDFFSWYTNLLMKFLM